MQDIVFFYDLLDSPQLQEEIAGRSVFLSTNKCAFSINLKTTEKLSQIFLNGISQAKKVQ